jgi:DNA repair protein RadC
VGRFAFGQKIWHTIFSARNRTSKYTRSCSQSLAELSVSEKLARYGSSALSGVEHLRLLVGKDSIADALLRHFGSLKALSRASFKELRQFLPKGKAEAVMAALSISNVADAEHALSAPLNNAEAIYRANLDMKGFHQEVVRVVLLDAKNRCITMVELAEEP